MNVSKENSDKLAEIYASLALVDTLVFGSAVNSFIKVSDDWFDEALGEGDDVKTRNATSYAMVMAITICMAASGIVVATMRYSEVKHMWMNNPGQLEEFVVRGAWNRLLQFYTWGSILLYLIGLALYSYAAYGHSPFAHGLAAIFSLGVALSLLTLFGFWYFYKSYEEHEKPKNVYTEEWPIHSRCSRWIAGLRS